MEITLSELTQRAKNGEVKAMVALGDYYNQNWAEYADEAEDWYEAAAKQGNCYAMMMTISLKKTHALVRLVGLEVSGWDWVKQPLYEAYRWCNELITCFHNNHPGIEKVDAAFALKNIKETSYYLALCKFLSQDFAGILSLLDDTSLDSAALLKGVILFKGAETASDYEQAYSYLSRIENNREYAESKKIKEEDVIYGQAAAYASICLRMGLGTAQNVNAAAQVLTTTLNTLHDERTKSIVSGELQHYRKKTFGGYVYVE